MYLARFRMINYDLLNKYPYLVPEQAPLIILYIKLFIYMSDSGKDTKHTRSIDRSIIFVGNGKVWHFNNTVCCERCLKLSDIETKNVMED